MSEAQWQFKLKEHKPLIANKQHVIYYYKYGVCEADYVRFTSRHLHQRVKEHKRSTIQNTVADKHGKDPKTIKRNFKILKKNFRVIIQNSPRLFYFHRAFTYISPPTQKRLFL